MSGVVVLQARTGSSRLPAKALLPVAGMPLAVLAAKRAANTGRTLLAAISSEPEDDVLAETLSRYGIPCYRGSLRDVLQRMVNAAEKYEDETVFVRLTADNVLPDGKLIEEVERDFLERSLDYLCCNGEHSGLPHGMSIEVTRLRHLREAARFSDSAYDREHVMPYVVRKFGAAYFDRYKHLGKGHFRCTVDVYEDYINICRLFSGVSDPVAAGALELSGRLVEGMYQPLEKSPVPQLVFGTAQLGGEYGIANTNGQPAAREAEFMLKTAIGNGVRFIDTGRAYGASEHVIGRSLATGWAGRVQVITKLSPMADCPEGSDPALIRARVDASVFESCARLGRESLDVLMLHRAAHLKAWGGAAWSRLLALREAGVIGRLGVSVQNPGELADALGIDAVSFVQLPFNILDHRWSGMREKISAIKRDRNLVVHARSALLQGLLPSTDTGHWRRAHVAEPGVIWNWLGECVRFSGCADIVDLCLRYVRSQQWIDGVVVGMETRQQLQRNIRYFNGPPLTADQLLRIESARPSMGDNTLNPALWSGV